MSQNNQQNRHNQYHRPPEQVEREMMQRLMTRKQREEFDRWRVEKKKAPKRQSERNSADTEEKPEKKSVYSSDKGAGVSINLSRNATEITEEYAESQQLDEKQYQKLVIVRSCVICVFGLVLALLFNLLIFHIPYTPTVVSIDFSSFPELWVGLAVHPLAGIAVVIVKNILYYLIRPGSIASIPGKIILDSLFILVTWAVARAILHSQWLNNRVEKREMMGLPVSVNSGAILLVSGLISAIATAFGSLLTFRFVQLPLLYKHYSSDGYTPAYILDSYRTALHALQGRIPYVNTIISDFDSVMHGALFYNVPIMLVKYGVCAVFVAVLYNVTVQLVHRR